MNEKKIIALVRFNEPNGPTGIQGFEDPFSDSLSIQDFKHRFESATNRMNNITTSKLVELRITIHDENGNWLRDEEGNRITKLIYP